MLALIGRGFAQCVTAALAVYWIGLGLGTHLPASAMGAVRAPDKGLHFLAYTGLAFLLAWTVAVYQRPRESTYAWIAAILLMYGALDELTQILVPGRQADFRDWFANATGIAAGLLLHGLALALVTAWTTRGARGARSMHDATRRTRNRAA
jgi:VanZ family protein